VKQEKLQEIFLVSYYTQFHREISPINGGEISMKFQ